MTEVPTAGRWRFSVGLYLLVSFVAFFPCLVLNQAYFDNDLLYQFVPFRQFLRDQLAQGHFPLWNPYLFAGQPFFANPNTMMAYPLNYLTLLFPVPYGLGVFFFIHMALAALGMHFWLRSLRVSETACRIASLTFALSGLFWWETIHLQILAAYALFPWLMGCLEHWAKEWRRLWGFLTGFCFALIFCCGGFQSTTSIFYTALCYFLFRLAFGAQASADAAPGKIPWKKIMVSLLFAVWGSLPLLTFLIPGEEFSRLSNRRDPSQTYDNFNGTFSMFPSSTYQFLFPTLGLPEGQTIESAIQVITDQVNVGNDFLGDFGYLGIWVPLAFLWAFRRKEKKFLLFLAGLGVLSILTAWGRYTPLHKIFCAILPGVDLSRAPFRFVQTYVLVACALLAYGYQWLERALEEKGGAKGWIFSAVAYASVLLLISFFKPAQTWREMLALIVGLGGLLLWGLSDSWKTLGRLLFQVALVVPLLLAGWGGFSLGPPSNFDYKAGFPPLDNILAPGQLGRFYFDQSLTYPMQYGKVHSEGPLPVNAVVPLGIRHVLGYSPIFLKKTAAVQQLPPSTYFTLMAVKGVLTGREMQPNPDLVHQALGSAHLYSFKDPHPFVYVPAGDMVLGSEEEVLEAMKKLDFQPAKTAYFYQPLPTPPSSNPNPGFSYSALKDEVDDQSFKVHMDAGGMVVFSEVMFPGWKAAVDDKPVDLLTADYIFRSVYVPAGDHQVDFHFEPSWWTPLRVGLAAWFLLTLGLLFLLLRKDRAVLA